MYELFKIINTNNGDNMFKKIIICIILFSIIIIRVIDIKFINYQSFYNKYLIKTNNIIDGYTSPRGKILDRNGIVLVDNKPINNINYRKLTGIDEISVAYKLTDIIDINTEANDDLLKKYYLMMNDANYLIDNNELNDYKYRRLSYDDRYDIKYERINDEIKNYSSYDKKMIYIFFLMQKGYKEDTKLIVNDVNDSVCARVIESNINGVSCDISYKRIYNYPYLNTIMGKVGSIPLDNLNDYLDYDKDDIVGISGLEKYYDYLLRGKKALYKVNLDNSLELINEEVKGNDLVLSLDINIVNKSFEILEEHLKLAKKFMNTDYYNHAYIIVGDPNTGEILSIAGLRLKEDRYVDITIDAITSSYTIGSIVKGASHTVGYLNNAIEPDKKIYDSCVKLYSVPAKCSFKRLGLIDDISALKMSSNYYQFITAIKTTGNKYTNNMNLDVTIDDFNRYRDVFKLYGLGSSTGIDFPKESIGLIGDTIAPDLFLNLSIGQYDNYTPLQLLSYINTIATNGKRFSLSFKKQDNILLNEIPLNEEYMKRIQKGFYEVVNNGTGRGYTDKIFNVAGKTGTAESFYNKDIITINQSYVMYGPYDSPKYSMVVVNPNISYNNKKNNYIAPINRLISKSMSDYLFNLT